MRKLLLSLAAMEMLWKSVQLLHVYLPLPRGAMSLQYCACDFNHTAVDFREVTVVLMEARELQM